MASLTRIEAAALGAMATQESVQVDPSYILPASLPLELSGESVRARLCLFTDGQGKEHVLRPDLTLPIANGEAVARLEKDAGEAHYHYSARAFRLPSKGSGASEFTQIGFERFGGPSTAEADAAAFCQVAEALDAAGTFPARIQMGDLAIFPAYMDALGLPDTLADLLKRAFRQAGGAESLLSHTPVMPVPDLMMQIDGKSDQEAQICLEDWLAANSIPLLSVRSPQEILSGLRARSAAAKIGGVPSEARRVAQAILAVDTAPGQAASALEEIAKDAELDGVSDVIARVDERAQRLSRLAPALMKNARFGAPFGRRFTYYDGFVFELFAEGAPDAQPYGAGGRYDSLIAALSGGKADASGIGGVVRPDRIAAALEARQ